VLQRVLWAKQPAFCRERCLSRRVFVGFALSCRHWNGLAVTKGEGDV
jgi:hypothetical protein